MSQRKWSVVLLAATLSASAVADNLGLEVLDAQLYKRLEKASQGPRTFTEWVTTNVTKRINISGQQQLGLHLDQVTGDSTAYDQSVNYGEGNQTVTDFGQVTVNGNKVLGLFNFNFQWADQHYLDPTSRRFALNYDKHGWAIDAGNINASLAGGNQFLTFARPLNGVSVGYTGKSFSIKAIGSQSRSAATTLSFNGLNTTGPYYLQSSGILADTVHVQVDGRELTYPDDYIVDSIIGSITFTNYAVPSTSTIVVSFESQAVNGVGGTVAGVSAMLSLGKFGQFGVAGLEQTSPNSSLSTYIDRFQGFGDPSTPYILQYVPLSSRPIVVTLDGITETPNVDYQFSTLNPTVFYFLRYIPTTSTITVTYTPSPTQSLLGTRQAEGFNYSYPFGKNGKLGGISFSEAYSHLSSPVTPLNGTASGISGSYRLKQFNFTASADRVSPGFVTVESTGFLRNEDAHTLGVEYKAKRITYNLTQSNSDVTTQSTNGSGQIVFVPGRTTNLDAGAKYHGNDNLTWSFDQQHLTSWSVGGEAKADETTFSLNKPVGKLNSRLNFGHTQGFGPISDGTTISNGSIRLDSIGWSGDYAASRGWTIGARNTLSAVDTNGSHALGTDAQASLSFRRPRNPFGFDASYSYSNSGEIATLGAFQDGSGLGYTGSGFSASSLGTIGTGSIGSVGTNTFNSTGTDVRRYQLNTNWLLGKRASVGATFLYSSQFGAISTNSTTSEYGLSLDYDLQNGQRLGVALDQSNTLFSDATESANSLTLDTFVGGRPKGPWSYRLAVGTLLTSGGSIAQNSFHYDASLIHYFKANQDIGLQLTSTSLTNYEPQNDILMAVLYEYRIFKTVALVAKYQIHTVTNLDPTVTTGAYRSRGLDLNVNFNFGS